jgi:hypothetical protein
MTFAKPVKSKEKIEDSLASNITIQTVKGKGGKKKKFIQAQLLKSGTLEF